MLYDWQYSLSAGSEESLWSDLITFGIAEVAAPEAIARGTTNGCAVHQYFAMPGWC